MDQQGGVTAFVHDEIGTATGIPAEGPLRAPLVSLGGLALPGEDDGAVAGDGSGGTVLGGEGNDKDDGLDGHAEQASDLDTHFIHVPNRQWIKMDATYRNGTHNITSLSNIKQNKQKQNILTNRV